jgi:organic radical activating enzyme
MYQVNEVFLTLQGEGMRAGEASVFVRFSGCNLACTIEPGERSPGGFDCDTEFVSGRKLTAAQLVEWVQQEAGA